jgi:hypothetical protein
MGMSSAVRLREYAAKQAITALLHRRGRAADAKDIAAIVLEHVPGSRDTHGIFDGTIEEFMEYLRTHNYADERYGLQRHTISNVLIEFHSPTSAAVESYHHAYHRLVLDSLPYDVLIGGRYYDQCVEVNGRWLLECRSVIYDWSSSSLGHDEEKGESK